MRQVSRFVLPAIGLVALLLSLGAGLVHASFPGGNGKLLYWTSDQHIVDFDTTNGSSTLASGVFQGTYSADGTKIATWVQAGGKCDLKVMNADGSQPVTITDATGCDYLSPSFSPDGTRLVFVRFYEDNSAIGVIDIDGSDEDIIVPAGPFESYSTAPSWSPDGQTIAFSASTGRDKVEIRTVHPDGSGLTDLTESLDGIHNFGAPDWAPDGSQILFTQNGAGQEGWTTPGVWVMDADGSDVHPILLTYGCPTTSAAVWSPDGQKIAYSQRTGNCGPGTIQIYSMDVDGSNRVQLTNDNTDKYLSDWQPSPAGGTVTVPNTTRGETLRNVQGFDVAADGTIAVVGVRIGEPDYGQTDLFLTAEWGRPRAGDLRWPERVGAEHRRRPPRRVLARRSVDHPPERRRHGTCPAGAPPATTAVTRRPRSRRTPPSSSTATTAAACIASIRTGPTRRRSPSRPVPSSRPSTSHPTERRWSAPVMTT